MPEKIAWKNVYKLFLIAIESRFFSSSVLDVLFCSFEIRARITCILMGGREWKCKNYVKCADYGLYELEKGTKKGQKIDCIACTLSFDDDDFRMLDLFIFHFISSQSGEIT